jgi:L-asparaginase
LRSGPLPRPPLLVPSTFTYTTTTINTRPTEHARRLLIVYTGGTLGMAHTEEGNPDSPLAPFDFAQILERVPELRSFNYRITVLSFTELIDSSDVTPAHWQALSTIIGERYAQFDGFVVIHGTDTMAYSASALSYMLEGLAKPVIFTGSQLPIGAVRTDARENLITALEMAAATQPSVGDHAATAMVGEVCIYFNNHLLRGNRARKVESNQFGAFWSHNYPPLAESGIAITYDQMRFWPTDANQALSVHTALEQGVALLKIFPGITPQNVQAVLSIPDLKGLVLESYGSGNAPTTPWLEAALTQAIAEGLMVLNVSQCEGGMVSQGRYATSLPLARAGVISGADITTEAALTKLMHVLALPASLDEKRRLLATSLRGEMTAEGEPTSLNQRP